MTPAPQEPDTEKEQPADEEVVEQVPASTQTGIPIAEYGILGICGAAAGGLGFGIFSDLKVLNWYEKKKRE